MGEKKKRKSSDVREKEPEDCTPLEVIERLSIEIRRKAPGTIPETIGNYRVRLPL